MTKASLCPPPCPPPAQRHITARLAVVTPMFIGDGVKKASSIRPPSIKGALRFWWRALNWGRILDDNTGQTVAALKQLHQQEAILFGAAAKEDLNTGQSLFNIRLNQSAVKDNLLVNNWPKAGSSNTGASYLSLGIWGDNQNLHREGIPEKIDSNDNLFHLTLVLKPEVSVEQSQQLQLALQAWGLLGGLGSRSRRGFGSVALVELDGESMVCGNISDYREKIQNLIKRCQLAPLADDTPLTALTDKTQMVMVCEANTARLAIEKLGSQYKTARGDYSSEKNIVFGLPIQKQDEKNRRTSPVMMHIHPIGNKYSAIASYWPGFFHSESKYQHLLAGQTPAPIQNFLKSAREVLL